MNNLTRKAACAAVAVAAILVVGASRARADETVATNLKVPFAFMVGDVRLPAGDYTVSHEMTGQTHVMIFKQVNGTAEAKANCNLVPLKTKANQSQHIYTTNAKNQRVLREMTFAGDTATHVLVD